jgi:hypothetical protein
MRSLLFIFDSAPWNIEEERRIPEAGPGMTRRMSEYLSAGAGPP